MTVFLRGQVLKDLVKVGVLNTKEEFPAYPSKIELLVTQDEQTYSSEDSNAP